LTAEYGQGFDRSALSRIVRLVEVFPDEKIFATLSQKLGWSHFKEILSLLQRTRPLSGQNFNIAIGPRRVVRLPLIPPSVVGPAGCR
jgi:hypothetical protein